MTQVLPSGENNSGSHVYDDYEEQTTIRKVTRPNKVVENAEPHLIVLQGTSIGRLYKIIDGRCIIGRALEAEIQLDDDGVSRKHAAIERSGKEVRLTDLGSTNGTSVNGHRVTTHDLQDADMILIGKGVVLKYTLQSEAEGEFSRALYEAATRDALTGLFNRRPFDDQLAKDFAHATRHESPLAVLSFDIDHFKLVNDTHGHLAGDSVLEKIGALVTSSVRAEDVACRMGGEEFGIVMRDTTWDGATRLAERLRQLVESTVFQSDGTTIPVTISVGIAAFDPLRHTTIGMLVEEADQAMYGAKRGGRNRVMAGPRPAPEDTGPIETPIHLRTTRE